MEKINRNINPSSLLINEYFFLFACFVLSVVIIDPFVNFPIGDDWSYASTVKRFVDHGVFKPAGWTSMPLITNVLWGSLFSSVFGHSHTVLRISTLVLSFIGMIYFIRTMKMLGAGKLFVIIAALLAAFNPLYFHLSNTFMTDVPFVAISIITMYYFIKFIKTDISKFFTISVILSILAILSRQTGLFMPLSFALFVLFNTKFKYTKKAILTGILIIAAASLPFYNFILSAADSVPELYTFQSGKLMFTLQNPVKVSINLMRAFLFFFNSAGIFLLPLILFNLRAYSFLKEHKTASIMISIIFIGGSLAALVPEHLFPFYQKGLVSIFGFNPPVTKDIFILGQQNLPVIPYSIRLFLTIFSAFSGAVLLSTILINLWNRRKKLKNDLIPLFIYSALIYALPVSLIRSFDRYYIILFFIIMFMLVLIAPKSNSMLLKTPAIIFTFVLAVFTLTSNATFFNYKQSQLKAVKYLETNNIPPEKVDAGFEYSGMKLYDTAYEYKEGNSWWWIKNDEYLISMGEQKEYKTIKQYTFKNILFNTENHIFIQRQNTISD